jgi:hypothetical protein
MANPFLQINERREPLNGDYRTHRIPARAAIPYLFIVPAGAINSVPMPHRRAPDFGR